MKKQKILRVRIAVKRDGLKTLKMDEFGELRTLPLGMCSLYKTRSSQSCLEHNTFGKPNKSGKKYYCFTVLYTYTYYLVNTFPHKDHLALVEGM